MLAIQSDIAKYHRVHTEGAVAVQTPGVFFDSPGRNYPKFCAEDFRKDLCDQITSELQDNEEYGDFDAVVTNTLNKHAPLKKIYLRANTRKMF